MGLLDRFGNKRPGPDGGRDTDELSELEKIRRGLQPGPDGLMRSDIEPGWSDLQPGDEGADAYFGVLAGLGEEDVGRPQPSPEPVEAVEPPEDIVPFNWWVVEPEAEKLEAGVDGKPIHLLRDQNEGARARRGTILSAPTPELNRYRVWTGCTVVFLRYAGVDFRLGGKNVVALREADIIGVVTPAASGTVVGVVWGYTPDFSVTRLADLDGKPEEGV